MEFEYLKEDFRRLGYVIKNAPEVSSPHKLIQVENVKYQANFTCEILGDKKYSIDPKLLKEYEKIISTLSQASHISVIQLYQHFEIDNQRFLIYEDCPNFTLKNYLKMNGKLLNPLLTSIVQYIARGMEYLHAQKISHNNLSLSTVMLDIYNRPKISGFGKSIAHADKNYCDHFVFSSYAAPEIKEGQSYNPYKADVFAFGVLVYALATGSYPYNINDPIQNLSEKIGEVFIIPNFVPKKLSTIIKDCLKANPNERPTFKSITESLYERKSVDLPPLTTSARKVPGRISGSHSLHLGHVRPLITPFRSMLYGKN